MQRNTEAVPCGWRVGFRPEISNDPIAAQTAALSGQKCEQGETMSMGRASGYLDPVVIGKARTS
jgi:hypothetical protein